VLDTRQSFNSNIYGPPRLGGSKLGSFRGSISRKGTTKIRKQTGLYGK